MNEPDEIDGDALARADISELKRILCEFPENSTVRESYRAVLRVVAFDMLAGAVPEGMTPEESVRQAKAILELLNQQI